jgi:hypothetical protein
LYGDLSDAYPTNCDTCAFYELLFKTACRSKQKNPGHNDRQTSKSLYGYQVLRLVQHALEIDCQADNQKWAEAIAQEILALHKMDCFWSKPANYRPPDEYQHAPLQLVFTIKPDG